MPDFPKLSDLLSRLPRFDRLPVAPSMDVTLARDHVSTRAGAINASVIKVSLIAILLAAVASVAAQLLKHLIGLFTNLFFFQRLSFELLNPYEAPDWGLWIIPIPVLGGIVIGLMARYGSMAIRGHGIPEAMEQILTNESRIPLRVTFLKPVSAAISIGTGGPFGAEGPIIATGAALGSVISQWLKTSVADRKTLLAAGAAAGMTAIFGSPVASVLLAIELLLFEFRPRSLIPVALAAATAESMHIHFEGIAPVFPMDAIAGLSPAALPFAVLIGAIMGLASIGTTKTVYWIEDCFERLPIHWMWWPAMGGLAVGIIGYFYPRTMGVGYENIVAVISGQVAPTALIIFTAMKFLSWSIALGSGTSGGTLAPLFTIGGGIGGLIGFASAYYFPGLGLTPGIAGLIGMAAIFAGASRALLASVVFAFEVTQQPLGLMPLLAGCSVAYLVSGYLVKNSIMTEKIVRRGVRIPSEYAADHLDQILVRDFATRSLTTLRGDQSAAEVIDLVLAHSPPFTHQGYPVLSPKGNVQGVITRKDFAKKYPATGLQIGDLITKEPVTIQETRSLRDAADLMTMESIGRILVTDADGSGQLVGIISRSDLLKAHEIRLRHTRQ